MQAYHMQAHAGMSQHPTIPTTVYALSGLRSQQCNRQSPNSYLTTDDVAYEADKK